MKEEILESKIKPLKLKEMKIDREMSKGDHIIHLL